MTLPISNVYIIVMGIIMDLLTKLIRHVLLKTYLIATHKIYNLLQEQPNAIHVVPINTYPRITRVYLKILLTA